MSTPDPSHEPRLSDRPRTRSTCNAPQAHGCIPSFFNAPPHDWSLLEYLKSRCQGSDEQTSRRALNTWTQSLRSIKSASDNCWDSDCRRRAMELLERYSKRGADCDRAAGRALLRSLEIQQKHKQIKAAKTVINISSEIITATNVGCSNVPAPSDPVPRPDPSSCDFASPETEAEALTDTDLGSDDQANASSDRQAFYRAFLQMTDDTKWILRSTGRSVEGVMQKKAQSLSDKAFETSLTRLWILDTTNDEVKSWFTPEEWAEICAEGPVASTDRDFFEYMMRYLDAKSFDELREILYKPPCPSDVPKEQRYDYEWVHTVMFSFLHLFENPDHPLQLAHNEDWYGSQIWSLLVDKCFLPLRGMTTERKEIFCHATQIRKNSARTLSSAKSGTRAKSGPRFDGITRTIEDTPYEYVVMEVGPSFHGAQTASKWMVDSMKTFKAMRDMLERLIKYTKNDRRVSNRLQVASVVTAGLHLQVHRLRHPAGHVCLLATDTVENVPTGLEELGQLLLVVNAVRGVRRDVERTRELVRGGGRSPEELLRKALREEKTPEPTLFPSPDTPP